MVLNSDKKTIRLHFLILLAVAIAVALFLFFVVISGISVRDNEYPSISPKGDYSTINVTNNFTYLSVHHSVTIPVRNDLILGAMDAKKEAHIFEKRSVEDMMMKYYGAFIYDPAQTAMYDNLCFALNEIRTEKNLSDAEYVECISAFVQSIPYRGNISDTGGGFPIETIVYGGDCDGKSALLIGLLSHEGYNVSMMIFPEVRHSAVGIARCDENKGSFSGYEYIETTTISPVGFVPEIVKDVNDFYIIRYGEGERCYSL